MEIDTSGVPPCQEDGQNGCLPPAGNGAVNELFKKFFFNILLLPQPLVEEKSSTAAPFNNHTTFPLARRERGEFFFLLVDRHKNRDELVQKALPL